MINVVCSVTKSCLKDFLLMRKSLDLFHDAFYYLACDEHSHSYLNGNFKNVKCLQLCEENGADHVSGSGGESFSKIIGAKFKVAKEVLTFSPHILWCDADHIFLNQFDSGLLDNLGKTFCDALLTPHFSRGIADEKTVGYYNCGFAFVKNVGFLNDWYELFQQSRDLNLYFEQKPLEITTEKYPIISLPENYNVGWWRFLEDSRMPSVTVDDNQPKINSKPLVNFHFSFFKNSKHAYNQDNFRNNLMQILSMVRSNEAQILLHEIERLQGENI